MYLNQWLDQQNISTSKFAERLGYNRHYMSRIINGKYPLNQRGRLLIAAATDGAVRPEVWDHLHPNPMFRKRLNINRNNRKKDSTDSKPKDNEPKQDA